ncbi:uncharacterized protein C9orf50 homolog [Hippopotamus amphibius kiboko]|uniref:uncharacterized protein C9orf50 homolog n=1 Tax=Hippopotamus amphibius kiboko TaxID=575201 RepID=UPI0025926697|nr:uncharacterized protein C9orf50 homolog [Hippopotamus amphibius kiboko]
MPWRHPSSWAQQVAPERLPGGDDRKPRDPLPPRLLLPELRAASGTGVSGGSRASEGGAEWWRVPACEPSHSDPAVGIRRPRSRLPVLPTVAQRAARNRTGLRSLLLPPLLLAGEPREPAPPGSGPGPCEKPRRGSARETPDSLGALLGEFLPGRFRQFLRKLGAESAEQRRPRTSSASQHQRGVSEHCISPPQCPSYSFLPDLGGQSSYFKNSLKKILLHQIPALGPFRRDHSQFSTVKKANHRPHTTQAPRLKAVLTHSSLGEGTGHRRQCCPFRVRFADETLQDTALRYWERSCAVRQGIFQNRTANRSAALERVFGSVGRWLESLPKALYPRAKEETMANSFSWDFPGLSTLEPKGHLSEDTSVNSSLPFIPRPTTQRHRGDLKSFLEQVGKSPCSWSQKMESFLPSLVLHTVLKRGCPKGYQLLLPSTPRHAQR